VISQPKEELACSSGRVIFEGAERIQRLYRDPKEELAFQSGRVIFEGAERIQKLYRDPKEELAFLSGRVIFEGAERIQKLYRDPLLIVRASRYNLKAIPTVSSLIGYGL